MSMICPNRVSAIRQQEVSEEDEEDREGGEYNGGKELVVREASTGTKVFGWNVWIRLGHYPTFVLFCGLDSLIRVVGDNKA